MIKYLSMVISILLLLSGGCSRYEGGDSSTSPSAVTPKVYLDPSSVTKTAGQDFTLNVYIENVTDLFYANVYLSYDPSKISYKSGTEGDFLTQGGTGVSFSASAQNGVVVIGITRLGSSSGGVSGTGTLCSVTFSAAVAGTSTVTIDQDSSDFRDANNNSIAITVKNGSTININ